MLRYVTVSGQHIHVHNVKLAQCCVSYIAIKNCENHYLWAAQKMGQGWGLGLLWSVDPRPRFIALGQGGTERKQGTQCLKTDSG